MTAKTVVRRLQPEPKAKATAWPFIVAPKKPAPRYLEIELVLLIEERDDGVVLSRFTPEGRLIAWTRHQTVDGAKQRAAMEFDDTFLAWECVPGEVKDVISFGLRAEEK
jgi:hypothetical protein